MAYIRPLFWLAVAVAVIGSVVVVYRGITELAVLRVQKAQQESSNEFRNSSTTAGQNYSACYAAGGLYDEIARLRAGRRATCDTIAAQQRQAGTSAVVVLGGLLEDADRMAGDLAAALERSRIAGLACEAVVDGIRRGGE